MPTILFNAGHTPDNASVKFKLPEITPDAAGLSGRDGRVVFNLHI